MKPISREKDVYNGKMVIMLMILMNTYEVIITCQVLS